MNIGIDGGPLSDGSATRGIGVYTKHLVKALKNIRSKGIQFEVIDANNEKNLHRFDLIHYPSFDFFFPTLPLRSPVPFVVTVHDAIPLIYPEHYPAGVRGKLTFLRQRHVLQNAKAVITDSETSKKDIIRHLGIDPSKIFPVYLGPTVDPIDKRVQQAKVLRDHSISFPYVLYIGDVNWNKNLVNLCDACEQAKIHLVIVGKKAVSTEYDKTHIENRPLFELQTRFGDSKHIHRVGFISDNELPILIANSQALIQPSHYEGFGLSVLDAMTLGVPTICGKTQALTEIYGDASVFFDTNDVRDIKFCIETVLKDKRLQKKLGEQGEKLSKKFNWETTAHNTISVYKKVLLK